MRVIIKNTKDLGTIRGLFAFLVFLVDAFHADTDQSHDRQQDGDGDDNAHAHDGRGDFL